MTFTAISLGWGVQSFTLAAMVALGELLPVDVAIHADTTHERHETYEFAKRWTPWLEERGTKVVTVIQDNPEKMKMIDKWGGVKIPAVTGNGHSRIHRQCTGDWKISPLRKYYQDNRNKQHVEQWLGISLDEFQRMRESDVKYITNRYPLVDRRMTRNDCVLWLQAHDLEVPHKSACVFCPFQSMNDWRNLKNNGNGDFKKAIEIDRLIRNAMPPDGLFLHQSARPLEMVDLRTPAEKGQLSLWDEECSGLCGV